MKIKEIFETAVKIGIDNDPRGRQKVEKILKKNKEQYDKLSGKEKDKFDLESLVNPYSDSAIHYAPDLNKEVRRVLVGIDIDTAEVLLAQELGKIGKKVDLIIAHHPTGKTLSHLHEVMDMQVEIMAQVGVPANITEKILEPRTTEVARRIAPSNLTQAIDAAKLLDIPLMNFHTPADNSVWQVIENLMQEKKPETLGEIIEVLLEVPEYKEAEKIGVGPTIFVGNEKSRAGKIIVNVTGGTNPGEKLYEKMGQYGIGTEINMHISDKDRDEVIKHYLNSVVAGHYSSDSVGMNIILDELEKQGVEIIACAGFTRVSRNSY